MHAVNCFLLKYSLTVKISIQTVATLDSLKPNREDRLWHGVHAVAFGKHDKHPQTLSASVPETPEQIFKLFSNHNLHMASEKHICQKDRKHVDCCHFLIIKSDETATGVGTKSQAHSILQDSGRF